MTERSSPDGRYPKDVSPDDARLSGEQVRSLMRKYRKTIRQLAESMDITQKRVRDVRDKGVEGNAYVRDWLEAIMQNGTGGRRKE
jgi:hypothetical protein